MKKTEFTYAKPVWIKGEETAMNVSLVLTASFSGKDARLKITGHSLYQVFVNGALSAEGPARAGHGFYRVDELDLSKLCGDGENELKIITAGYNVNSFYLLDQPSFVCAELYVGGDLRAATGKDGFSAYRYGCRVKKSQRYSFQRPFSEVYTLPAENVPVALELTGEKNFIERGVPYPDYDFTPFCSVIKTGSFGYKDRERYYGDRSVTQINEKLKGYPQNELTVFSMKEAERLDCAGKECSLPADIINIPDNGFAIADLGAELTGFFSMDVKTDGGRFFILFDEILSNGDVDPGRFGTCGAVIYDLQPGSYRLVCFEPYSARYVKLVSEKAATVSGGGMIRFEYTASLLKPAPDFKGDGQLQRIYEAAVSTFRQNTVDIYMDCPSRERAGWLCDSFFTSRVEYELTGKSLVERNFLENFIMPEKFDFLPDGMLPMCYPSDHNDGTFIPNWAMWYVIELEEYLRRSGDTELIGGAKKRVLDLLSYFRAFENGDGLLERLKSWVFIEWSKSNELTQHINYPTNMLYCKFKRAIGNLYSMPELEKEADRLAEKIREKSFTGKWFCDNSVYGEDGVARLSGLCTESCQYYAFFSGVATKELYPKLWKTLVEEFGPDRKVNNKYPEIFFANAFIGNYLRLELLYREGLYDKVIENIRGYFDYMAKKTGTLWENVGDYASCNHGFASHVAVWLCGIYK